MVAAELKVVKRQRFESVFDLIVDDLVNFMRENGMPQDAVEWYRRSLEYNTPGGKLNRGLSVVDTAEILLCTNDQGDKMRELSDEEYNDAAILGWCVELLQAYFLVADDMMDASITRRGHPCWYRLSGVGNIAINDSFMLDGAIYFLLKKYFRTKPFYVHLLELFHDTTFQTELGQLIDLITAPEDAVDLNKFSLDKHHLIVVYKTAFYSFYLPVALAMAMCGIKDESAYKYALDILIPLGEYFQVQDDYLDAYVGTDIRDNKCSWNINVALANSTQEQRKVLDENYGQKDDTCEARVKDVFNASNVNIQGKFAAYEKESYDRIHGLINALPENAGLKRAVFVSFFEKVYKRTK
ncbi:Erg20p [Malassezia vespertilionis]|uniref:(2E,6E)-farnesyl diphosphate synthase n=1 Tax=Malassezia vespertilionis TaxID=2020962 RepID=A0A2N1JHK2_9BASI|nr:Erg20p [Malassezia vespertilionis]